VAAKTYLDFLASFEAGVNGGIEPLLLPKNQLARAENATVRGAYISPRPPKMKRDFIFASPLDQTTVETGLFQGGGYYRPDYGTEQLIAQISGHLFSFTETGGSFTVADISVPGDLNDVTALKVWMWQSEKWMIIQDGTGALPIFFDGAISRRSYGESQLYATVNGVPTPAVPPAIGGTITVNLTAQYAGLFNVPVIFNGEFYQPVQSLSGYAVSLLNTNDTPGLIQAVGSQVSIQTTQSQGYPILASASAAVDSITWMPHSGGFGAWSFNWKITVSFSPSSNLAVGINYTTPDGIIWNYQGGGVFTVSLLAYAGANPNPNLPPPAYSSLPYPIANLNYGLGTLFSASQQTITTIIGLTTQPFTVPAQGSSVQAYLSNPYTGVPLQVASINGKQYNISSVPNTPSSILYLINLSDASIIAYAVGLSILSVPELPAGRMGAYGQGRNWACKTDGVSFLAGDIVGGAAGTEANNYRDSVLKTTETTFMSGGGDFNLPTSGDIITAMLFPAVMDNSLGQGALQIGTANSMFSVNLPTDRTLWTSLTTPILPPSLVGKGPLGQDSTISANSDVLFREFDGLGALVQARRDFSDSASGIGGGNTPISREMDYIFRNDDQTLLQYGSSKTFDNRYLTTYNPIQTATGVVHSGLVVANMDLVSNLRTKLPPVYEGAWTNFNILKLVAGQVNGYRRAFAFTQNPTTKKTELYEFLTSADPQILDNGTDRISWNFDTPIIFNKDIKPINELIKLTDGEIYTKDISGTVDIEVQYRPDFNSTWTTWHKFTITPKTWKPRLGLGLPSATDCETNGNRPMRVGYFFQCRAIITGNIKFMGMRFSASVEPETTFANPICNTI